MATLTDLLTIMRTDVLRDTSGTQKWSDAILTRYINNGLRESWPNVYTSVTDSSTTTSETAGISDYTNREYSLPSGVPDDAPKCPVWMVEVGPVGGSRTSDAKQWTDRYQILRGRPNNPAWWLDLSRRKLVLRNAPQYDDGATYTYYLRISYVRPIAALAAAGDTLEGPEHLVIPYLQASVMYQAYRSLQRQQLTNRERLANLANLVKQAEDERMEQRRRMRLSWPNILA